MSRFRVLVIGGNGFFGGRLVQLLQRDPDVELVVASRSSAPVATTAPRTGARTSEPAVGPRRGETPSVVTLDAASPALAGTLHSLAPAVVVHTAGPFQGQDYRVASACIEAGVHYVDLADGREFVGGIGRLDPDARRAGVVVTSGASSVPALSSAAADELARGLRLVQSIDIGISPGNRTDRGLATVRAILTYCGQPLPDSGHGATWGWSGTWRHDYPAPVGSRLLSPCDVPDLVLLRERYAARPASGAASAAPPAPLSIPAVRFGAGLELRFLQRGMNAMAWAVRAGIVSQWSAYAGPLRRASRWFQALGSDAGAMHVTVEGEDADGRTARRTWSLVATHGDGPFVPTLAATALVRKLKNGAPLPPGAGPCVGLLALSDFEREFGELRIRTERSDT